MNLKRLCVNNCLTAGALAVLLLVPPRAAEYHVAVTGDDANRGSPSAPLRTIQRAADLAQGLRRRLTCAELPEARRFRGSNSIRRLSGESGAFRSARCVRESCPPRFPRRPRAKSIGLIVPKELLR